MATEDDYGFVPYGEATGTDEDYGFVPDTPTFTADPNDPESYRLDGTLKGPGFLGPRRAADGKTATELSVGVNIDGRETLVPSMVPSLREDEVDLLLSGEKPTTGIIEKAADHARYRMAQGLSPFKGLDEAEAEAEKPAKADFGFVPDEKARGRIPEGRNIPTAPEVAEVPSTAYEEGGMTIAGQYVPEEDVPAAQAVLGGLANLQFVQQNLLDPIKRVSEYKQQNWQTGAGKIDYSASQVEPEEPEGGWGEALVETLRPLWHKGTRKAVETGLSYLAPMWIARATLPKEHPARQITEGLAAGGGALGETLTNEDNLALVTVLGPLAGASGIAGLVGRGASAWFSYEMAKQMPELWKAFKEAPDIKTKTAIATEGLGTLGLSFAAAKHAVRPFPIKGAVGPDGLPLRPTGGEAPPMGGYPWEREKAVAKPTSGEIQNQLDAMEQQLGPRTGRVITPEEGKLLEEWSLALEREGAGKARRPTPTGPSVTARVTLPKEEAKAEGPWVRPKPIPIQQRRDLEGRAQEAVDAIDDQFKRKHAQDRLDKIKEFHQDVRKEFEDATTEADKIRAEMEMVEHENDLRRIAGETEVVDRPPITEEDIRKDQERQQEEIKAALTPEEQAELEAFQERDFEPLTEEQQTRYDELKAKIAAVRKAPAPIVPRGTEAGTVPLKSKEEMTDAELQTGIEAIDNQLKGMQPNTDAAGRMRVARYDLQMELNRRVPSAPPRIREGEKLLPFNKIGLEIDPVSGEYVAVGSRWGGIENTYIKAKAAQEAWPGEKLENIHLVTVTDLRAGQPGKHPEVAHRFVRRGNEADAKKIEAEFPTSEGYGESIESVTPMQPTKGDPTFPQWLAGVRPPGVAGPVSQIDALNSAIDGLKIEKQRQAEELRKLPSTKKGQAQAKSLQNTIGNINATIAKLQADLKKAKLASPAPTTKAAPVTIPAPPSTVKGLRSPEMIRREIERRAKALGIPEFNLQNVKWEQKEGGIEATFQNKYTGKFHKTVLKNWRDTTTLPKTEPAAVIPTEPAPVIQTAGPEVTKKAEAAAGKPEVSPAKLRVQKEYLLGALDKAIADARETTRTEHDADLETVKGSYTTDYELTAEASAAAKAQNSLLVGDLYKKYGLEDPGGQRSAAGQLKLEVAIEEARIKAQPKVVIEVPGDGTFTLINSKEALRKFRDEARKNFPATIAKADWSTTTTRIAPTQLPKVSVPKTQEDVVKIVGSAVSKDEGRGAIVAVHSTGDKIIATDGRRLVAVDRKGPKDKLFDPKTGKTTTKPEGKFPDYKKVMPDPKSQQKIATIDTGELMKLLKQGQQVQGETVRKPDYKREGAQKLWVDKDGRIGITASNKDVGDFVGGAADPATAKFLVAFNGELLADGLRMARQLGLEKVDLYLDKKSPEMNPIHLKGKGFDYVLMPMRMDGGGGQYVKPVHPAKPTGPTKTAPETPDVSAMRKRDLIEELLGPKPGIQTATKEERAKWDADAVELSKLSKTELADQLADRMEQADAARDITGREVADPLGPSPDPLGDQLVVAKMVEKKLSLETLEANRAWRNALDTGADQNVIDALAAREHRLGTATQKATLERQQLEVKIRDAENEAIFKAGQAKPGEEKVWYHGTPTGGAGITKEGFKEETRDEFALFGPGFYFTEHPAVATGYSGLAPRASVIPAHLDVKNPFKAEGWHSYEQAAKIAEKLGRPDQAKKYREMDAQIKREGWTDVGKPVFNEKGVEVRRVPGMTGGDLYNDLLRRGYDQYSGGELQLTRAELNQRLQKAGFDGITYDGGKFTPTRGITKHAVTVVFDRNKIRFRYTKEKGGTGKTWTPTDKGFVKESEFEEVGDPHLLPEETLDPTAAVGAGGMGKAAVAGIPQPPAPPGHVMSMRMPVKMGRTGGRSVSVPQIINSVRDVMRAAAGAGGEAVPIRIRRFKNRARGIYKWFVEVMRLDHINNIPTAIHEMGHVLMKQMYGTVKSRGLAGYPSPVSNELIGLGKGLYGSNRPYAGYTAEGFSEFMRYYLTTDEAPNIAPNTVKFFEGQVLKDFPELVKPLNKLRTELDIHRLEMGAIERANRAMVDEPSWTRKTLRALRDVFTMKNWVESAWPIRNMVMEAEQRLGRPIEAFEDPYKLIKLKRGSAGPIIDRMVNVNMLDPWGRPVGPPLKESFKELKGKKEVKEWTLYMWARRAQERWRKGINPGMTAEDAAHIRQTLESPKFEKAANGFYEFWDGILAYVAEAAPQMADLIARIKQGSSDYAPLARLLDEGQVRSEVMKSQSNPFYRMKGSGYPVKNILDQTLIGASRLIEIANRHMIANAVFKLSRIEGMGRYVEEIPRNTLRKQVSIAQIEKSLQDLGIDTTNIPEDQMFDYYIPADQPKGSDPVISHRGADGELRWYVVDPEIYDILGKIEPFSLRSLGNWGVAADIVFGVPKRAFTMGTTGLRASFGLVWNPIRDIVGWLFNTKAAFNPAKMTAEYFQALGDSIQVFATGKESAEMKQIMNLGVHMAQPLGRDISYVKKARKGMFHGRFINAVTSPVDLIRQLLNLPEGVPRHAEAMRVAEKVGWKPGQQITPSQAVEMGIAFREATVDFNAAGNWGRIFNEAIAFMNPNIQGLRTAFRATKAHPYRVFMVGMALTGQTLYNWWKNKDEEWYKNLPYRERYMHTHFDDGTNVWQFPRAFEWGNAFQVVPEALADSWYRKDPQGVKEAIGHIFETQNPVDYPVLMRAGVEQWKNRIDFWDRPIVPRTEVDLPPGAQVGTYTSKVATWLGKAFPERVSPRRVDAAIRSIGGGAVPDLLDSIGLGVEKRKAYPQMADIPVLGRLWRRDAYYSAHSQHLAEFYDIKESLNARAQAMSRQERDPSLPQTIPYSGSDKIMSNLFDKEAEDISFTIRLASQMKESKGRQRLFKEMAMEAKRMVEEYKEEQKLRKTIPGYD